MLQVTWLFLTNQSALFLGNEELQLNEKQILFDLR